MATRQAPEYDATAFLRIGDPAVVKDALGIGQGTPILNQPAATPPRFTSAARPDERPTCSGPICA